MMARATSCVTSMFIAKWPYAAVGNSDGACRRLEWTGAGSGASLKMLVHLDGAVREYVYVLDGGSPDGKVGNFSNELITEAKGLAGR